MGASALFVFKSKHQNYSLVGLMNDSSVMNKILTSCASVVFNRILYLEKFDLLYKRNFFILKIVQLFISRYHVKIDTSFGNE